mgnify:CR=1 FL=1
MLPRALVPFVLLASVLPAQEEDARIRVISYNVQFLPGPARVANARPDAMYRAGEIGRLLASYDIVALNETFDARPRRKLIDRLREAWGEAAEILTGPHPDDWRANGGLCLASRFPFVETHSMIYEHASSVRDHGIYADGIAAKGVLHARVARKKEDGASLLDVFVTHLDARDARVREGQYGELAGFVHRWADPERPALILGDLNTSGDVEDRRAEASSYRRMMSLLSQARSDLVDLWTDLRGDAPGGTTRQVGEDGGRRIDYILVARGKGERRLGLVDVRVNRFLDPHVEALSDHSAVESVLEWPR